MKDVLIDITGTQTVDGSTDVIEFTTEGQYYKYRGRYHVRYPEHITTGLDGITTTLKIGETCVSLSRRGRMSSELTVERDRRHVCHYDTGFGLFSVGVFGKTIRSTLDEGGGELVMRYAIDIDMTHQSDNEIKITVRDKSDPAPGLV